MTTRRAPIARVALARSLPRLLALPGLLVGLGAAAAAAGGSAVPGPTGVALVAVGAVLALAAMGIAAVLLSVRLDVEESAVHVIWIGGGRVYVLTPGPVTRIRLHGPNASRVRVLSGIFGWGLGRAVLRGEERIHIVRLAETPTAILVPTDRGRLAIAPASDDDLLDALSRAARARQRLEAQAAALEDDEPAQTDAEAVAPAEAEAPAVVEARDVPEPRMALTGIERALLEERLAEEREAAELAALAAAAERAAAPVADLEAPAPEPEPEPVVAPAPTSQAPSGLRRFGARAGFVVMPLLGAGVAWFGGLAAGRMPDAGSDLARLTSLALVMAGPATSVAAVMALAWWPRLVGVVVTGGLVASVFIGRALIAP